MCDPLDLWIWKDGEEEEETEEEEKMEGEEKKKEEYDGRIRMEEWGP